MTLQALRTMHTDTILAGRYRIVELLGSGNMGEVYRAVDLERAKTVAVKRIHPHLIADKDAIQRFEREAKALSRLNHPGIVKFHDFYVEDGVYFIVLNYLDGETLEERCSAFKEAGEHFPLEEVKTIAHQLCEALTYAHQRHVIHRDLKPSNVMISPQGHAILMDFGIAKLLDGDNLTSDGLSPGTPGYMSPELIRGQAIDTRSDLYTLGVILYELVAGRRPFQGNSRYDTLHCHLFDTAPDIRQFNSRAPASLAQLIAQTLAKDPENRYQTAEALAEALRQVELIPTGEPQPLAPPMVAEVNTPPPITILLPRHNVPVNSSLSLINVQPASTDIVVTRPQPTPLQSVSATAREAIWARTFRQIFPLSLLVLLLLAVSAWGLTRVLSPITGPENPTHTPDPSPSFTQTTESALAPILSADTTPTVTAAASGVTPTLAATPTPSTTRLVPTIAATATRSQGSQPSSPNTPSPTLTAPRPTVVSTSAPIPTSTATVMPTVGPTKTSPPDVTLVPLPSLPPSATAKPETERTPTRKSDEDK